MTFQSPVKIFSSNNLDTIIEGVVTGSDEYGKVNKISSINPIVSSSLQAERDIVELIYEPLLKVTFKSTRTDKFDQETKLFLAKEIVTISTGAEYQIILRDDVYWHDGAKFSVDDVIATFDLVSKLTNSSSNSQALAQLVWEPVGNSIRICTKVKPESNSCNEKGEKPFFSNFLELISIKILPKHKLGDITKSTFDSGIPELFRNPVGTGIFKFAGIGAQTINLTANDKHYNAILTPNIKNIQFKFFKNLDRAINALKTSEIHSLATASSKYKKEISFFPNVNANLSPVIYNQYWGIYFNLRKNPNGNPIGSKPLQDSRVRQALHYALNREEMLSIAMENMGKKAAGPIPEISTFYNPEKNFSSHDIDKALRLLDEAGWIKFDQNQFRINENGEELSFKLYFVDATDRNNLAKYIQYTYERIGVRVDLITQTNGGLSLQELNNQYLTTGLFDAIIYGVSTFIDPDRYELFHSSQSRYPGLNISGYSSTEESKVIGEVNGKKELVSVPKVDKILNDARSLDPLELFEERRERYFDFQRILFNDMPLIFLFHPQYVYYTNTRLSGVDLSNANSIEERFINIHKFKLLR